MSCKYYYWDGDYYCSRTRERVDEDWYYSYCRNYDYDGCHIYKNASTSGGCYLTSACVEAMGLPDDCLELTTLRDFRDNWLAHQPGGKEEIKRYYEVAPGIVTAIHTKENAKAIFTEIYNELILPCVALIQEGKKEEAWKLYRDATERLKGKYVR